MRKVVPITEGVVMSDPQEPEEDEFRNPAKDKDGHASRVQFTCPGGLVGEAQAIIESRYFPSYRVMGDLVRHGFIRHLKYLKTICPVKRSKIRTVEMMMEICRQEEDASDFAEVFDRVGAIVSSHCAGGHTFEAIRFALEIKGQIEGGMPEGFWKDRYLREWDARFGKLVENQPGVGVEALEDWDED
jgi:hypothetical protein